MLNRLQVVKLSALVFCVASLISSTLLAIYLSVHSIPKVTSVNSVFAGYTASSSHEADVVVSTSADFQKPEFGYILALSYFDQLTGSVANLLSMQCWAPSISPRVRVVEPFLQGAVLGLDTAHLNISNAPNSDSRESVTLFDVYDRAQWVKYTTTRNYTPLVGWDHFIKTAPLRLIIVDRQCFGKKKGKCMECRRRSVLFLRSVRALVDGYGFQEVQRVCYPMELIQRNSFRRLVYQDYPPEEVVVVFNTWGGIQLSNFMFRLGISGTGMGRCNRNLYYDGYPLSTRMKRDAARYTQRYMPEAVTEGYISVMVRLEQFSIRHHYFEGKSHEEILILLQGFYMTIIEKVRHLKSKLKTRNVFLTMDCGGQGSGYFAKNTTITKNATNESALAELLSNSMDGFFAMLYGNSSSVKEWEDSFYSVSSFRNRGYVATLQKHLAANGTCLITAGGGAFQSTAMLLFSQYHPGTKCFLAV
jgi:hypothetical protein